MFVLMYRPGQAGEEFSQTSLRRRAEALVVPTGRDSLSPGEVLDDIDGREARLFGITTSGSVALFDQSGALLFHGGITPSRGHEGDNAGCAALTSLLAGRASAIRTTPVYGCSIGEKCDKENENVVRVESQP